MSYRFVRYIGERFRENILIFMPRIYFKGLEFKFVNGYLLSNPLTVDNHKDVLNKFAEFIWDFACIHSTVNEILPVHVYESDMSFMTFVGKDSDVQREPIKLAGDLTYKYDLYPLKVLLYRKENSDTETKSDSESENDTESVIEVEDYSLIVSGILEKRIETSIKAKKPVSVIAMATEINDVESVDKAISINAVGYLEFRHIIRILELNRFCILAKVMKTMLFLEVHILRVFKWIGRTGLENETVQLFREVAGKIMT